MHAVGRTFQWLSGAPLPARFDLRQRGWDLLERGDGGIGRDGPPCLLASDFAVANSSGLCARTLVLCIDATTERALWLERGYGDVADSTIGMSELEARLSRIGERAAMVPRRRIIGRLTLELVARDGYVAGRPLGLHPREFALLWRLAECPGSPVDTARLLTDVWRLSFRPETNSLAVHISRLRAKLRVAGLDGLVETTQGGDYRLAASPSAPAADLAPDAYVRNDAALAPTRQDQPACGMNSSPTTVSA